MLTQSQLKAFCAQALRRASAAQGVLEAEVYASDNAYRAARLCYSSHIPCNGLEEPKSVDFGGYSVRVAVGTGKGLRVGVAYESGFDLAGVDAVVSRASAVAVEDKEFQCLPKRDWEADKGLPASGRPYPAVSEKELVASGWRVIDAVLGRLTGSKDLARTALSRTNGWSGLGIIVSGDVSVRHDRAALASTALPEAVSDESFNCRAIATVMIESLDAKGSGFEITDDVAKVGAEAGADAAASALASARGEEMPSGRYPVVLGRFAVKDLMENLVLPSVDATAFYAGVSAFMGKAGKRVAVPALSIYDDSAGTGPQSPKGASGRGFAYKAALTDEGLPVGRTDLVTKGVLTGLLASDYETRRLLASPKSKQNLGLAPERFREGLVPRNGFRVGDMGRRCYDTLPAPMPTNTVVQGSPASRTSDLVKKIGDGVYIGRIWYTYAVNGLPAGDFSSTVVADSHIVKNGRIVKALKPNSVRINENIRTVLNGIVAFGKATLPVQGWYTGFVLYTPEIAVKSMRLDRVCAGMSE
ncbi:MAG: hypothetical protein HY748_11340 [Elusimicrobia bacterium]|nr:hypothetical protein [Elusimicrobiota bacterium]